MMMMKIYIGCKAAAGQIGPNYLTQLTVKEDIIDIYHNFNECGCNSEVNLTCFVIVTIFVNRHVCSK